MWIKTFVTFLQGAAVVAFRPRLEACKGAHDTWVNLWNILPLVHLQFVYTAGMVMY